MFAQLASRSQVQTNLVQKTAWPLIAGLALLAVASSGAEAKHKFKPYGPNFQVIVNPFPIIAPNHIVAPSNVVAPAPLQPTVIAPPAPTPILPQPPYGQVGQHKIVKPPKDTCGPTTFQMKSKLRTMLHGTGATVKHKGQRIIVNLPSNVTFDSGSAYVKPGFRPMLRRVARRLARWDHTRVRVLGHTDSIGGYQYNQGLSEARASSVASILNRNGVGWNRMRIRGFGETRPIADNYSAAGRAANRRVELTIVRRPRPGC